MVAFPTLAIIPRVTSHWWHVRPMARTIRDVALGYSILQGPDGIDGCAIHARDAEADGGSLAGQPVRVGWVSDAAFAPVDTEDVTAAVAAAARQLADLGCAVEEVTLPFLSGDPSARSLRLCMPSLRLPSKPLPPGGKANCMRSRASSGRPIPPSPISLRRMPRLRR